MLFIALLRSASRVFTETEFQVEDCEPYDPEATVEESSDEDEAIKRADDGAEVHEEDKEDKASDADDEAEEEEKKEKEKEEEKDKEEEEKDKEEEEKKEEDDEEKEKDEDKEKHKDKKHDESEGTVTLDGNAEEFTPTVVDADDFSAEKDAGVLSEAMQGFGTNEHMMVDIVGRRSRKQRNEISVTYKTMFGKDLIEDLDSELSGDLQELILGLFKPADYYDAWCLREAMKGPGTKDHILIEILCTRTNDQIAAMVNAYKENFSADLEQDIHDDTSGEFKQLMVSCCQGARTELSSEQLDEVRSDGWEKVVDRDQATEDAQRLFEAGENRWGTDESVFLQILALRNYYQLRGIFEEYEKIAGCDIIESISGEMSGNFEDGLKALVKSARNRPEYFADKLHDALSGVGTKDTSLIRIIISRSEIDLKDIQEIFQVKYQQALATMIDSDTSGDYKQLLLTIVGK